MSNSNYKDITMIEEVGGCLLCNEAPCTKACPHHLPVDSVIRSLRFENKLGAAVKLPQELPCKTCTAKDCEKACLKGKVNRPLLISDIMEEVDTYDRVIKDGADLSIHFCGIECENPFFLSSSVVGSNYEMVAKAFEDHRNFCSTGGITSFRCYT